MVALVNVLSIRIIIIFNINSACWVILHPFWRLLDFFKKSFFSKKFFQEHNQCQMNWIQTSWDIMLVLIWVKTVCKGCQQTTKVVAQHGMS